MKHIKEKPHEYKKRYTVTLDKEPCEKVNRILKKANLSLSSYMNVMVIEFSKIIDETGISEKLDKLSTSDALKLMAQIFEGLEEAKENDRRYKK